MTIASSDLPFASSAALPFDLYEPLVSWVFQLPEFRQWMLPKCKWQLRLIGGPGSGKTTLSALIGEYVRTSFRCPAVRVASIYFAQYSSIDGPTYAYHILREIGMQLSAAIFTDPSKPTFQQAVPLHHAPALFELEALRKIVTTRLAELDRAFLILDDIDFCSQSQWIAISGELLDLQHHGLNVLTTSRLSLWHKYSRAVCDTGWQLPGGHGSSRIFWYCACQGSFDGAFTICQKCKDAGYECNRCNRSTSFIEPYDYVALLMDINRRTMSAYVSHALESVHGDLGLFSPVQSKPPHSKLGRLLSNSMAAVIQLRRKIVDDAEGNITMAKLRLETIDGAATIEEVMRYGDRLPAFVVACFDDKFASIQERGLSMGDLGLKVIIAVANGLHGRPYADLQQWLRRQDNLQGNDGSHIRDFSIETVLRATAGFLLVNWDDKYTVKLYHHAVTYYVTERYNEALFRLQTSIIIIDREIFEHPRRLQTWHASRKHLTRADTWK